MQIKIYRRPNGNEPYVEWFESQELSVQARIAVRLDRVASGHMGDTRNLGDGLYELRFSMRSGYRIYLSRDDDDLIVLLLGGNKSSQKRDIEKAREYLLEYHNQSNQDD